MITVRLDKNNPDSFALYPLFERRVVAFAERYLHLPLDQLRDQTLKRWVNTPLAAGYWLGLDETSAVAHLLSYVGYDDYGRPSIEFFQIEADDRHSLIPVMATVGAQVAAWVRAINLTYETAKSPLRVTGGNLSTWHDQTVYQRFFEMAGLQFDEQRTVMRCTFGDEAHNGTAVTAK